MKNPLLINMKIPTIVGIFIFVSRENFEHEKHFIASGPDCGNASALVAYVKREIHLDGLCYIKSKCPDLWGSPAGSREQVNNDIYFRGTGQHKSKNEGNRGINVILGSRKHKQLRFSFWGTRENAEIFQGNKGIGTTPTLGGPHLCLSLYSTVSTDICCMQTTKATIRVTITHVYLCSCFLHMHITKTCLYNFGPP